MAAVDRGQPWFAPWRAPRKASGSSLIAVGDARVTDVPPRVSRNLPVPCPPGKRTIPPTVCGYWIDVSAVADAQTIVI
jgi:hypothetical protein